MQEFRNKHCKNACREGGKRPEVGFEDGCVALVLAEAAIRSAAEARTVIVSEIG